MTKRPHLADKIAVATAMVALGHADNLGGLSMIQYRIMKRLRLGTYDIAFIEAMRAKHPGFDRVTIPKLVERGLITIEAGVTEITPMGLLTVARKQRLEQEARARRPY